MCSSPTSRRRFSTNTCPATPAAGTKASRETGNPGGPWPRAASRAAPVARAPEPAKTPLGKGYDFPSAASIPPVSIMNAEPPLPKEATDARAAQTPGEGQASAPVPPKRPQDQAAPPPVR